MRIVLTVILLCCGLMADEVPKRWQQSEITWTTEPQYREFLQKGFSLWQEALGGVLTFREVSIVENPNIIVSTKSDWSYLNWIAYAGHTLTPDKKTILAAKIVVIIPDSPTLDLVLIHEIGHVLGLDHSDNQESVMHPVPYWNTLHRTDVENVCALYGVSPIQPNFGIEYCRISGKKWLLKTARDTFDTRWFSTKLIRVQKFDVPYIGVMGQEVVVHIPRYPFEMYLECRGYRVYFTIEKPLPKRKR